MDAIGFEIFLIVVLTFVVLTQVIGRRMTGDETNPLGRIAAIEVVGTVALVVVGMWVIDFFDLDTNSTRVVAAGAALVLIVGLLMLRLRRGQGASPDEPGADA